MDLLDDLSQQIEPVKFEQYYITEICGYRFTGAAVLVELLEASSATACCRHQQVLRPVYSRRHWSQRHHDGARVLSYACRTSGRFT